jgi:hypothetical protein
MEEEGVKDCGIYLGSHCFRMLRESGARFPWGLQA